MTPYYPTVSFLSLSNSQVLGAVTHSTWVKQKDKDLGLQDTLVQCQTFEVEQNVTLGSFESKVSKSRKKYK